MRFLAGIRIIDRMESEYKQHKSIELERRSMIIEIFEILNIHTNEQKDRELIVYYQMNEQNIE